MNQSHLIQNCVSCCPQSCCLSSFSWAAYNEELRAAALTSKMYQVHASMQLHAQDWAQAQKKLVRDRLETVTAAANGSLPAVTPHQAAVLGKKLVLVKRYSATEAMQIHAAAAAAESERADTASRVTHSFCHCFKLDKNSRSDETSSS